jgi:hypothetical protein
MGLPTWGISTACAQVGIGRTIHLNSDMFPEYLTKEAGCTQFYPHDLSPCGEKMWMMLLMMRKGHGRIEQR